MTLNAAGKSQPAMSSHLSHVEELLRVEHLSIGFPRTGGSLLAAYDVGLTVAKGRTLGLVGESGSGKSVTLRALLGLVPYPGEVLTGEMNWRGRNIALTSPGELRGLRGRDIGMVFQDPMASLNPVMSVGDALTEVLRRRKAVSGRNARAHAVDLLARVGIPAPQQRVRDYPHQLSGGMRQRVMIALAIAAQPSLLLADEPTTALDVTVQEQVLELLLEIQRDTGMSMIIVSHDFGVIGATCDDIAVMYGGRVVECGTREAVLRSPRHPYTRALMAAVPQIPAEGKGVALVQAIPGQPPEVRALTPGCIFAPRCPWARPECGEVEMVLDARSPDHGSACPYGTPE
jgi:oligopeptide/dipeptide ABC transporter ATP-binding protein